MSLKVLTILNFLMEFYFESVYSFTLIKIKYIE